VGVAVWGVIERTRFIDIIFALCRGTISMIMTAMNGQLLEREASTGHHRKILVRIYRW